PQGSLDPGEGRRQAGQARRDGGDEGVDVPEHAARLPELDEDDPDRGHQGHRQDRAQADGDDRHARHQTGTRSPSRSQRTATADKALTAGGMPPATSWSAARMSVAARWTTTSARMIRTARNATSGSTTS